LIQFGTEKLTISPLWTCLVCSKSRKRLYHDNGWSWTVLLWYYFKIFTLF